MKDSENMLTFAEAADHIAATTGVHVGQSTVWRWARKGIGGLWLECRLVGNQYVTSKEAIGRFFAAVRQTEPVGLNHKYWRAAHGG